MKNQKLNFRARTSHRFVSKPKTKLGFSGSEIEKIFEFARTRYASPELEKPINYSYQSSRKPDQIGVKELKSELDAANFAINEIKTLAADARETFQNRRLIGRAAEAREYTQESLLNGELEQSGDTSIEPDGTQDTPVTKTDGRRKRRVRRLFGRR